MKQNKNIEKYKEDMERIEMTRKMVSVYPNILARFKTSQLRIRDY